MNVQSLITMGDEVEEAALQIVDCDRGDRNVRVS